ncbi:MAG: PilZ domain-containing protein [Candidatus Omnitrophota bacterium]|nr:PilZ domain-containing protein [Candidatus Omnitrophota bacterium]
MIKKDKYITVKRASKYLSIPLRTVYRLVNQGMIKSIRIGGKINCLLSDVEHCYEYGTNSFPEKERSANDQFDKRKHPRSNTNLICRYLISLPPFKDISSEAIIKNLSAGGVFLFSQNKALTGIDVDDRIELSFLLDLDNYKTVNVDIKGRVVRKSEKGIAVKFRDIDENIKKSIKKYVG